MELDSGGGLSFEEVGFMFAVMLSKFEITADQHEDVLLHSLSSAPGFASRALKFESASSGK